MMLPTDVLVVIFGLIIGSFLNVCIYRIPSRQSVVFFRSYCPDCRHPIRVLHNIPIFSYLLLLGKCGYCGKRISWVYPVVEATTAVFFYLLFLKLGLGFPLVVNVVFFGILIILIFVDLFGRILPDVLTIGGLVFGLLMSPLQSDKFFQASPQFQGQIVMWINYIDSIVGILVGGGALWIVYTLYLKLRKMEGIGLGDVKMMAMIGAFLGWNYAWLTIVLGSLLGVLVGSVFIYLYRKNSRYELPFGSFLGVAAVISTLFGNSLLVWYSSLFQYEVLHILNLQLFL